MNFKTSCHSNNNLPHVDYCIKNQLISFEQLLSYSLYKFNFSKLVCVLHATGEKRSHIKIKQVRNVLTSLNAHQSSTKPSSLKSLSTVVRFKSRGQGLNLFPSGFTSSSSLRRAGENWALLPILSTTLSEETLREIIILISVTNH
jgi:hypothetical protein